MQHIVNNSDFEISQVIVYSKKKSDDYSGIRVFIYIKEY